MKSFFTIIGIIALVGMMIAGLAQAATDSVTATVTVTQSAVSLSQENVPYGSMANNTASSTLSLWSGAGIIATNDGSTADFDIYGANTTGGTGWTLATATSTADIYAHRFCNDTDNNCTTPWTDYTPMTTGLTVLKAGVTAAGTVAFQLQMHTPYTSTVFVQQSTSVTIQASAI